MNQSSTGLPAGIRTGSLGRRFVAYLIDSAVPGVLLGLGGVASQWWLDDAEGSLVLGIASTVIALGWWLLCWWMLAIGAATPGMRVMKLQLVGLTDGRPVGWTRALLRALVLSLLLGTGLGAILLVVFLILDVRHRGWHDKVAGAVVIAERRRQQSRRPEAVAGQQAPQQRRPSSAPVVGLPSHLTGERDFSGAAGQSQQGGSMVGPPPSQQPAPTPAQPTTPYPQQPPMPSAPAQPAAVQQPAPAASSWTPPPPPSSASSAPAASSAPDERLRFGPPPQGDPPPTRIHSPLTDSRPSDSPMSDLDDGTRVVQAAPRPLTDGWVVVLEDAREIPITGAVLFGRNPQADAGEKAELVRVGDHSRTVSKTHLLISVDDRGAYVIDRGSTNGSAVASNGEWLECAPGQQVRLQPGTQVSYGDHVLEVRRSS